MTDKTQSNDACDNAASQGALKGYTGLCDASSSEAFRKMQPKGNGTDYLPAASAVLGQEKPQNGGGQVITDRATGMVYERHGDDIQARDANGNSWIVKNEEVRRQILTQMEAQQTRTNGGTITSDARSGQVTARSNDGQQEVRRNPDGSQTTVDRTNGMEFTRRGDTITVKDRDGHQWTIIQGNSAYDDYDMDRQAPGTTKQYANGRLASKGSEATVTMGRQSPYIEFNTNQGILVVDAQTATVVGAREKGSLQLRNVGPSDPLYDEAVSLQKNHTVRGWAVGSNIVQAADGTTLIKNPDGGVKLEMRPHR